MKTIAKIFGIGIFLILVVIGASFAYVGFSDIPSYEIVKVNHQVISTPKSIERGEKLVSMLCAGCHLDYETRKLIGKKMMDAPTEFGTIYSQNITQDIEYGIGNWSDGELIYLLRTGIKKDGQYSPPYMAKLPNMADEDIDAIISFLRSNHSMVLADGTPDYPSEPSLLTKLLSRVAFKPFPMPTAKIELPDSTNQLELGKYLAVNLECFSCHSADFKTNDFLNPSLSVGYFAGGNKPLNNEGLVMNTPNLTPDEETGIGNWSKSQFVKAVKYGQKEGETALQYPMQPYTQLSDYEAGAIYEYLKTIPAIQNKVERSVYN